MSYKRKSDILLKPREMDKFCKRMDRDFGCKKAFGCNLVCPLWLAREVEWLMNNKGVTMKEAYRSTVRSYVGTEEEKRQILLDAVEGNNIYPEKDRQEIIEAILKESEEEGNEKA